MIARNFTQQSLPLLTLVGGWLIRVNECGQCEESILDGSTVVALSAGGEHVSLRPVPPEKSASWGDMIFLNCWLTATAEAAPRMLQEESLLAVLCLTHAKSSFVEIGDKCRKAPTSFLCGAFI